MKNALLPFVVALAASPLAAQVVPAPQSLKRLGEGALSPTLVLVLEDGFGPQADAFAQSLRALGVTTLEVSSSADQTGTVSLSLDASLPPEGYALDVDAGNVDLSASDSAGAAYGLASLLQLVEVEDGRAAWPRLRLRDHPDRPYRSFMVDMGRNPHSPTTLRHVIDAMWFCKANYLQLHLTDDQLFYWPSRAFPKLYSERAGWTWQDFADLERYSQARGVTLVPELEVPGHSTIMRREYPDVFGKNTTELATLPEAQRGIEVLLTEMLSVFQATPYVHIGGDEAYGVPQDHQRDLINRLNAFVKKQGRRPPVWEGPRLGKGDNKVEEDVIHLNWRTIEFPAQQMLDAGYEVVSAPWDPLYVVDHYPKTMFTAVDVERCYAWDVQRFAHINHGMETFANPHRTKTDEGLLGFCMPWWEGREENLLPLCVPRLTAVASAAWNRGGENDFAGFQARQQRALRRLEQVSGFTLPAAPYADPETQTHNAAYRAKVAPSAGATQPHFGPARLTNGIPDRFDHFLGFPTQPDPLEILIELREPADRPHRHPRAGGRQESRAVHRGRFCGRS